MCSVIILRIRSCLARRDELGSSALDNFEPSLSGSLCLITVYSKSMFVPILMDASLILLYEPSSLPYASMCLMYIGWVKCVVRYKLNVFL
jgi:hypothetical protein